MTIDFYQGMLPPSFFFHFFIIILEHAFLLFGGIVAPPAIYAPMALGPSSWATSIV